MTADIRSILGRHMGADRPTLPAQRVEVVSLPVGSIDRDETQPRQTFDEEKLRELSESLRQHGQLQPIRVRRVDVGKYVVVAGERRWRAAQLAGIERLQAIVIDERLDREAIAAQQIVENLQRADVDPVELATFFRRCLEDWACSQAELARRLSTSPATVCRALQLLEPAEEKPSQPTKQKRRRGSPTDKRRGRVIDTRSAGTIRLKRGFTVEQLVEELRGLVDLERRDAA